jgi:pantetheine-phosphate adenylyltransferase
MTTAVYPGSFDPITTGHVDLIKRVSKQFDQVVVVLAESPEKKYLFSLFERMAMVNASIAGMSNVTVATHQGLTIDFVKKVGAQVIVRGLRAVVDFEYEMTMASMNRKLAPEIETMLLFASPETYFISSRAVKEVARYGGDLTGLVPQHVGEALRHKIK